MMKRGVSVSPLQVVNNVNSALGAHHVVRTQLPIADSCR